MKIQSLLREPVITVNIITEKFCDYTTLVRRRQATQSGFSGPLLQEAHRGFKDRRFDNDVVTVCEAVFYCEYLNV